MAALIKPASYRWIKAAALVAVLFSSFYYATVAKAVEEKAVEEKVTCAELTSESDAWYDVTHTFLSTQFCEPAAWFDDFFSSPRLEDEVRPGSRVRWRNDFVQKEYKGVIHVTTLTAKFRLPKAKKSLHLVFEGERKKQLTVLFQKI
jgi:hypothetical protein